MNADGALPGRTYSGAVSDLGEQLRAHGKRLTRQRVRVLDAVRQSGHATPDEITALVLADGGPPLSVSTVYRCLDALQELGLLSHTHVDHRVPSYHLSSHSTHIHLVCRGCGHVDEVPVALGASFTQVLASEAGFVADLTHSAVHGHCRSCSESAHHHAAEGRQ